MDYKYFVKIIREGAFYSVYNDDAYVLAYIMKYKLVYINENNIKTGFPVRLLDEVLYYLNRNKVSHLVVNNSSICKDYKSENRYLHFLHREQSVDSIRYQNQVIKEYKGSFKVQFDGDDSVEEYIISNNIDSKAEIVEKVFNNQVGSIVTLNSGIKFKIISKDLN